MPDGLLTPTLAFALTFTLFSHLALSETLDSLESRTNNNPLNIDWSPAPAPQDGPPLSAGALRDTKYLPAQIGAIVAAYGVSLVIVAITLLSLAKKRREHLQAGNEEIECGIAKNELYGSDTPRHTNFGSLHHVSLGSVPNFSYPSPINTQFEDFAPLARYIRPSPVSVVQAPAVDPRVDQSVVAADRKMAQSQLEDMYKLVMEHEDAKQRGVAFHPPAVGPIRASISDRSVASTASRKEKVKPASLNLAAAQQPDDKTQSRTSAFFSSLRSPRKKHLKGVEISSPLMTPQSGTFPRESQEMNTIPPRNYAPPPPPPIPTDQIPFGARVRSSSATGTSAFSASGAPLTPDMSPESIKTIDERLNTELPFVTTTSNTQTPTEVDPPSATSVNSQTPLVGLPTSPKPGATFPALPSSPKPGATFQRANAPSAVRTGGNLPLRAYEPALGSPSAVGQTTKQTVFERRGPLSPTSGRTPMTAGAVPYSPYQPFTPVIPMTPSLVTKEDRKRMKRLVPKTPTMDLVQSSEEMW